MLSFEDACELRALMYAVEQADYERGEALRQISGASEVTVPAYHAAAERHREARTQLREWIEAHTDYGTLTCTYRGAKRKAEPC